MSTDRGHLSTERANPASAELDRLATRDALALLLDEDRRALDALGAAHAELAELVDAVAARLAAGGRWVSFGAGTSGRLAVLDASELPPTFGADPRQVRAVIAGGPAALTRAVEGAEDDAAAGAAEVDALELGGGDLALGVAAGGTTPFVHGALRRARARGAATALLACVSRAEVPDDYDHSVRLLVGPEVVTGSTRMKAGTVTKLALNAISTLAMVRLGKVHGNLMVDVDTRANHKLVDRGERLVMQLAGVDRTRAASLLESAGGQVKLAVVLAADGDLERARARLARAGGRLRDALEKDPR